VREKTLADSVKQRMSTAELSDVKVDNVTDPIKPFVYSYHVKVPGYAQRTGKRLLVQPGFFTHGAAALFPTSARKYAVYFHYPWSEEDTVAIELPAGFEVEEAEAPNSIGSDIIQYEIKISVADGRTLQYSRTFEYGRQEVRTFSVGSYPQLKSLFDTIHARDDRTITLKTGGCN
jgi:hypothetical protein